jgi:hypothetical protein
MGGGRLRVDLDALARLADAADDVGSRLGDQVRSESTRVGHEGLDRALAGFSGRWSHATARSRDDVGALAARLVCAHGVYRQMDADLAAATRAMAQVPR